MFHLTIKHMKTKKGDFYNTNILVILYSKIHSKIHKILHKSKADH